MSRPRISSWLLVVALPLVWWIAAALVGLSWRSDLPDPLAVHFDLHGTADGFASLNTQMVVWSVLIVGVTALFAVLGAPSARPPAIRRAAAGLATGMSVFLSALHLCVLGSQRGLADAADAELSVWWLLPIAAGAVLLGGLVSRLGRGPAGEPALAGQAPPAGAPRVDLAPGATAVWSRSQAMAPAATAVLLTIGVVFIAVGAVARIWPFLLAAALILLVFALMGLWTVTVDADGLRYRAAVGWPRRHLPLATITGAEVITANPLRDSGGWGLRLDRQGRFGLYLRSGPALLVRTADGGGTVVTVDDAETAAGLLNSLLDRVR